MVPELRGYQSDYLFCYIVYLVSTLELCNFWTTSNVPGFPGCIHHLTVRDLSKRAHPISKHPNAMRKTFKPTSKEILNDPVFRLNTAHDIEGHDPQSLQSHPLHGNPASICVESVALCVGVAEVRLKLSFCPVCKSSHCPPSPTSDWQCRSRNNASPSPFPSRPKDQWHPSCTDEQLGSKLRRRRFRQLPLES